MAVKRRSAASAGTKKPAERVGLGGGSVDKHLKQKKKRSSNIYASVGDGNTIVIRAVDTKKLFKDGYVHPVEFERQDGSTYTMDVRCLDPDGEGNPCPGCKDDLDRRYKFWMVVILRDAPKENKNGKVIGTEDQIRILSGANRLAQGLNAKQKRRDITKRDLEIYQEGVQFETKYEIEWATDEDIPLDDDELELLESEHAQKVLEAFERYTELRDIDEFYEAPQSNNNQDDDDDIGERSKRRGSVFAERKKKASATKRRRVEEDDDEEDEKPRKRKIANSKTGTKRRTRSR
jgi:hypothetical protein